MDFHHPFEAPHLRSWSSRIVPHPQWRDRGWSWCSLAGSKPATSGNVENRVSPLGLFYHEKKGKIPGNCPNKTKPMMLKPIICIQYIYIYIIIYIESVVYEDVYEFTIHQCCLAIHSTPVFDGSDQHRNVATQARFAHSSVSKMGYTDDQSFYTGILRDTP